MTVFFRGERRQGTGRLRKGDKKLVYEDTRIFSLYSDDPINTTRGEVLVHPSLPKVGLFYNLGLLVICTSKDCQRMEENPREWEVTCEFSSDVEENKDGSKEGQQGSPIDWVPIASVGFETYQFYQTVDLDGKPFANSAGEPFNSSLPIQRTLIKWEFDQMEPATLRLDEISERNEVVNSQVFKRIGPQKLKLQVKNASLGYYYGTQAWLISYCLTYKPDGWNPRVADIGSFYKQGGQIIPFQTNWPNPQNTTGFLNGNGGQGNANNVFLLDFRNYEQSGFTFLRI